MEVFRENIKKINSSFWHPNQRLWSVVNTSENLEILKILFDGKCKLLPLNIPKKIEINALNPQAVDALLELEKILIVKRFSESTVRTYKNMLTVFLSKFMECDLKQVTKEQIEGFVYQFIKKNSISESYQNQIINALKPTMSMF